MALAKWNRTIQDDRGVVVAGAQVEVVDERTGQLARIYSDRAGATAITNPFSSGADGQAQFHAAGGAYKVTARWAGFEAVWRWEGVGTAQEYDFDGLLTAVNAGILPFATRAQLMAFVPETSPIGGVVWADPAGANGYYIWNGSAWSFTRPLLDSVTGATITNTDQNNVVAVTVSNESISNVLLLYLDVPTTNTGPVTIDFNNTGPLPALDSTGEPFAPGTFHGRMLFSVGSGGYKAVFDTNAVQAATAQANRAYAEANRADAAADDAEQEAGRSTAEANRSTTEANRSQTQAGIATTQAGVATTQANRSQTEANRADTAADNAEQEANRSEAQANTATNAATTATNQAGVATTQAGIATTQAGVASTQAVRSETAADNAEQEADRSEAQAGVSTAAAATATQQAGISTTQAGVATTQANRSQTEANRADTAADNAEQEANRAESQAGVSTAAAATATQQADRAEQEVASIGTAVADSQAAATRAEAADTRANTAADNAEQEANRAEAEADRAEAAAEAATAGGVQTVDGLPGPDIILPEATTTTSGKMLAADKTKLNSVATGANVTNATTVGAALATPTPSTDIADGDRIAGLGPTGTALKSFRFETIRTWIQSWLTKAMVGLGNVANKTEAQMVASGAIKDALDTKLNLSGGTLTGPLSLQNNVSDGFKGVSGTASGTSYGNVNGAVPFYSDGATVGSSYATHHRMRYVHQGTYAGFYNLGVLNLATDNPGEFVLQHINDGAGAQVLWRFSGVTGDVHFPASLNLTSNLNAFSDERLKSDVKDIKDALSIVLGLQGKKYTKDGREQYGFMAQHSRGIAPELVTENTSEDDQFLAAGHDQGTLSMDAGNQIPALIVEALRTVVDRLEKLERRL